MPNWTRENVELAKHIVSDGDEWIKGQVQLAVAADQRAARLAGIFTTSATALIAAMVAGHYASLTLGAAVFIGGIVASLTFLVAAALAIYTIRPVDFYLPGSNPNTWYGDLEPGTELWISLGAHAENLSSRIDSNEKVLSRNSRLFWRSIRIGFAAPILGAISWMIARNAAAMLKLVCQ